MPTESNEFNINAMFSALYNNVNVRRLVVNDNPNALGDTSFEFPKVTDLILDRFFPVPKKSFTEEDKSTIICIYLFNSKKANVNNVYQYTNALFIDILTHIDSWILTNGLIRPYQLMKEIDLTLLNTKVKSIRGNLSPSNSPATLINYNDKFHGYRMIYEFTEATNAGKCRG